MHGSSSSSMQRSSTLSHDRCGVKAGQRERRHKERVCDDDDSRPSSCLAAGAAAAADTMPGCPARVEGGGRHDDFVACYLCVG